jgi:hypothetical protein
MRALIGLSVLDSFNSSAVAGIIDIKGNPLLPINLRDLRVHGYGPPTMDISNNNPILCLFFNSLATVENITIKM